VKLSTKFALAVVGVTSITSLAVGFFVINIGFDAALDQSRGSLFNFENQIKQSKEDPVSVALLIGESNNLNISYVEADGNVTTLVESFDEISPLESIAREMDLGSNEKLVLRTSISNVIRARDKSIIWGLSFAGIAALLSGLTSYLILRRDLRAISSIKNEANQVANGTLEEIEITKASSELVSLSVALNEMTRQLQASRVKMKTFIGDASHELNTPLTVIRGYLDLLDKYENLPSEKRKVAIDRSLSESLRMQQLIADLLQLAQLEEAPSLEMVDFDLAELIRKHTDDLKVQQPQRRVDLFLEDQANFIGAPNLMAQVLANAFQNIVRYTKEEDPVRITLQSFSGKLYLLIEDGGPGIASLQKGQVINSFNRFDESRSRSSGGSGLGLSIMARIVDLHGGAMELSKSQLGGLQVSISFLQQLETE
jgi:signal transduction histidine kinase